MHIYQLHQWEHGHRFSVDTSHGEKRTWQVIILTTVMMVIEIITGFAFGSMALLADGWHMGTHAAALGISVFAYSYARRHQDDPRYSFGTGKVGALGGFTSSVVLAVVALLMAAESVKRLLAPEQILFNEAIAVAIAGLIVNIVSALLLQGTKAHSHHEHKYEDHNLKAAYLHVAADALTSLLAIIALLTGKAFGWNWMDPLMGIVGAAVITRWAYGLMRDSSKILLDRGDDLALNARIRSAVQADSDNRVSDLHIWPVGSHHLAAVITIVTHFPKSPDHYKKLLASFDLLSHITIEVHKGLGDPCLDPDASGQKTFSADTISKGAQQVRTEP